VPEEKFHQLKTIGMDLKCFSTNKEEGWIQVKCNSDCSIERLIECNKVEPTIFLVPSGIEQNKVHPKFFHVPYSSHCNYIELRTFVRAIMPFKLSFNIPYIKHGSITQRGPEIFLKKYVRNKRI